MVSFADFWQLDVFLLLNAFLILTRVEYSSVSDQSLLDLVKTVCGAKHNDRYTSKDELAVVLQIHLSLHEREVKNG